MVYPANAVDSRLRDQVLLASSPTKSLKDSIFTTETDALSLAYTPADGRLLFTVRFPS